MFVHEHTKHTLATMSSWDEMMDNFSSLLPAEVTSDHGRNRSSLEDWGEGEDAKKMSFLTYLDLFFSGSREPFSASLGSSEEVDIFCGVRPSHAPTWCRPTVPMLMMHSCTPQSHKWVDALMTSATGCLKTSNSLTKKKLRFLEHVQKYEGRRLWACQRPGCCYWLADLGKWIHAFICSRLD